MTTFSNAFGLTNVLIRRVSENSAALKTSHVACRLAALDVVRGKRNLAGSQLVAVRLGQKAGSAWHLDAEMLT
jgi:hypothetical protein